MSSATSTERPAFRTGHFFVVAALAAATAAVMLSPRTAPEHLVMLSLTVFAAGAAATAAYRMLAPLVAKPRRGRAEPLGRHARAALEAEKAIVLRTIKELEFDRAMKKVSDEDFEDMSQRLRHRAVGLMQQLDDSRASHRARIELELDRKLGSAPDVRRAEGPHDGRQDSSDARARCASCETLNDADARFCKACGQRLGA